MVELELTKQDLRAIALARWDRVYWNRMAAIMLALAGVVVIGLYVKGTAGHVTGALGLVGLIIHCRWWFRRRFRFAEAMLAEWSCDPADGHSHDTAGGA